MQRRWIIVLVGLILVDGMLLVWWLKRRSESSYDQMIELAARRYGVDPALVKAVIWQESGFKSEARGRAGEIGLMQIRALAAEEWARAEGLRHFAHEHVADPRTNILAGTWYLGKLVRRYQDTDHPLMYGLADYNAGRTHVLRWMQKDARTNSAQFISQMDFPGTQHYIHSVLQRHEAYRGSFPGTETALK